MIFLLIPVTVFFLDFFIKFHVERTKKTGEEKKLGNWIIIRRMSNYGIAGSKLKDNPKVVWIMNGIAMLLMGVAYGMLLLEKGRTGLKVASGFLLGGGASNFFDRCKKGYVTDYVRFRVPFRFISRLVFNISDFFIFIGCILGVIFSLRPENGK